MEVTKQQLESWTSPGAEQSAKNSHTSIREAVSRGQFPGGKTPEVFLQGSYKNHTNIRGDSDVDVVCFWPDVFYSNLSEEDKRRLGINTSSYTWDDFESTVRAALTDYYGSNRIRVRNKAIAVRFDSSGYVPADVVVSIGYRLFDNEDNFQEGISLLDRTSRKLIVNFPKQHSRNGDSKASRTSGEFRKVVRASKNARNKAIEEEFLDPKDAPSYFVESLVYNVVDSAFDGDILGTLWQVIQLSEKPESHRMCQNGITPLFGGDTTSWTVDRARAYGQALRRLLE